VAALLAWIGYNAPNSIPGRKYYTVKAELNQADNLTSHYQVRVAGRLVGQVLHPRVEGDKAVVDLQLEDKVRPLLSDSTIRVRPRSPIGVRFLELNPGTKGKPIPEGGTLPASQASAALPLDTALSTLDAPTRARTRELLAELGTGFAGRGEELNPTIQAAPEMLRDTASVTRTIADRQGASTRLVQGLETAARSADPVRRSIAEGFEPESRALKVFGDARASIEETLKVGPAALEGIRGGLAQSDPFVRELGGFARQSLPFLRQAPEALNQTAALLREARPTLRSADRTLDLAGRAVSPTLFLLRTLQPALPDIERALREATAPVVELGPRRCDITLMFGNWASMLAYGTNAGNYLRLNLVQNTGESLGGSQEQLKDLVPIHGNPYPGPCDAKRDPLKLKAAG
jgi:ABC-type transporter Mla subunit MlaD